MPYGLAPAAWQIATGHNDFLSAALMSAALVTLDRHAVVSGILFGLLVYKPQYGLTVPFVLAATGRRRTFAAAAATTMLLALLATLAFGPQVWEAFATSTQSPWRYSFHSASSP